eukprot:NODE_565_length_6632_cov_0.218276.p5 type:complete len:102 gc:universal NODE_565_length_6632_cov_0.218276:2542-2847(+)
MIIEFFNPLFEYCPENFDLTEVLENQNDLNTKNKVDVTAQQDPERLSAEENKYNNVKPKRKRRLSRQINRIYVCEYSGCDKAYEKQSHLKTHKQRKHHDLQ